MKIKYLYYFNMNCKAFELKSQVLLSYALELALTPTLQD